MSNMPAQVWSCGGGTQSAAIAALIVRGDLPKPDYAYMVDTGRERTATIDYFHKTLDLVDLTIERTLFDEDAGCAGGCFT